MPGVAQKSNIHGFEFFKAWPLDPFGGTLGATRGSTCTLGAAYEPHGICQ